MWRPRQGILLAVMALISVGPTAAFSGLGITRLRTGAQISVRRLCAPSRTPLLARDDLADRKASSGGQGQGKLLEFLEFVIGTTFQSPLYVGSSDLHMAVPLPAKDAYPEWFPNWGRLPQAAYDYADRGVEEGWIKRAPADQVFEIKYGVMRGEVQVLPDSECAPCELEKRKQLEQSAAADLVNIGEAERSRRTKTGYAVLASSVLAAYLAVDAGPAFRFPVGFLAVLGYAFVESGKNGL